jgi:WD40 repeat protein
MTSRGPQHFSLIERLYKRSSGAITSHQFQSGLFSSQNCMDRVESSGDLVGHRGCVNAINFNVDGSLIVTGSDDKTVKIWNTADRRCITTLYGHQSNVFATNFLPHKQNT